MQYRSPIKEKDDAANYNRFEVAECDIETYSYLTPGGTLAGEFTSKDEAVKHATECGFVDAVFYCERFVVTQCGRLIGAPKNAS